MPLEIKNHITWTLFFPSKISGEEDSLNFEQPLLHPVQGLAHNEFDLLETLQEVFYVISLNNLNIDSSESKAILDKRDDCWNILRGYFGNFFERINGQADLLIDDSTYKNKTELMHKKGRAYANYVRYNMGKPVFYFRYEIFQVLKLLVPINLRRKNNLQRCADIVCDGNAFQKFFNLSIDYFEKTQKNIQSYDSFDLEKLLKYLSQRDGLNEIHKQYIKGIGCFSLTQVYEGHNISNLLCFSGLIQPTAQQKQVMDKIANHPYFGNCDIVNITEKIRYHLFNSKIITYGDALRSGLFTPRIGKRKGDDRMFSCCERKTFAYFDWKNCTGFRMIVKYAPCELCVPEVDEYILKYHGILLSGKSIPASSEFVRLMVLANAIYWKQYPMLCLPYYAK